MGRSLELSEYRSIINAPFPIPHSLRSSSTGQWSLPMISG